MYGNTRGLDKSRAQAAIAAALEEMKGVIPMTKEKKANEPIKPKNLMICYWCEKKAVKHDSGLCPNCRTAHQRKRDQ